MDKLPNRGGQVTSDHPNSAEDHIYLRVEVRNPRIHIHHEKAQYTDYAIWIDTNDSAFAIRRSCVRRRYSEFEWLHGWLSRRCEEILPLPPKRLFGRFKHDFLTARQQGLQVFLEGLVTEAAFLSDAGFHLFLQSTLSVSEIIARLNKVDSDDDFPWPLVSSRPLPSLPSSVSLYDVRKDSYSLDEDSGYFNSNGSSMNDLRFLHGAQSVPDLLSVFDDGHKRCKNGRKRSINSFSDASCGLARRTSHRDSGRSSSATSDNYSGTSENYSATSENYHDDQVLSSESSDSDEPLASDYDADVEGDHSRAGSPQNDDKRLSDILFLLSAADDGDTSVDELLDQTANILRIRSQSSQAIDVGEDTDEWCNDSDYDIIDSHDEAFCGLRGRQWKSEMRLSKSTRNRKHKDHNRKSKSIYSWLPDEAKLRRRSSTS